MEKEPESKEVTANEVVPTTFEPRIQRTKPVSKPLHIPKADRLVIDLRDDSSDSSDEEQDRVEISIAAFLKTARQSVEEKNSTIPNALSHLPRNQQEEYQRLKQEIFRRENKLMMQGGSKSSPSQSQSENLAASHPIPRTCIEQNATQESTLVSIGNIDNLTVEAVSVPISSSVKPTVQKESSPAVSPQPSAPTENCSKENQLEKKLNQSVVSSSSKLSKTPIKKALTSPLTRNLDGDSKLNRLVIKANDSSLHKTSALKQQLLLKK